MTGFSVELQCPQCGAPAELVETERLFDCPFCRVKSFLVGKSFFRYALPARAPEDADLFWVPYWHFRGMVFSFINDDVQHRVADASIAAVTASGLPESLGLRSQALKLRFMTDKEPGRRIKPRLSLKNVTEVFQDRQGAAAAQAAFTCHIGEQVSLIYAPFYIDDHLYDGILNKYLPGDAGEIAELPEDAPAPAIRFVPTICPGCGWDLNGAPGTLALSCTNCDTMWQAGGRELERLPAAHIPTEEEAVVYLPFWRIQAAVSGVILNSYADLVRVANLPRAPRPEWEEIPFHFWSPAFKSAPQSFLRLGHNLTLSQPRASLSRELPRGRTHPVTLPVAEAVESLKITLAAFIRPRKKLASRLPHIHIRPMRALLVHIPFREGPHELIHSEYKLTVNRNMLKMSSAI